MPTRIVTLGREKRLATLARKIFSIEGPNSAELQLRIEAALLRANPQLARKEAFQSGATIVVPQLPGLLPKPVVDEARADSKGLTNEAKFRLKVSGMRIEEQFRVSNEMAQKTLALVASEEFRTGIRESFPDVEPLIDAAQVAIEKRESENTARKAILQNAILKAIETVESLRALAERTRSV